MRRRPFAVAALVLALILLAAVLVAWLVRFRVATAIVERRLAAARVPASYQITRIGPFLERMENVRIGNPSAPDLIARRIDVHLGYALTGPSVRAISVDGVRLHARIDSNGLSLGALDRLLPKSAGGQAKLPDLGITLHDTQLLLDTPNGRIEAALQGQGNPAHRFRGNAHVAAASLRLASCALDGMTAKVAIAALGGKPEVRGPVQIDAVACPSLKLAAGTVRITAASNETFDRVSVRAALTGFAGQAGPARFAAINGTTDAAGKLGDLQAKAQIRLAHLSLPAAAQTIGNSGKAAVGTPLEPTAKRAAAAFGRLLANADATADLDALIQGEQVAVQIKQAELKGRDGGRLIATAHDGMSWSPAGWRADADIATGGGALPALAIQLRQRAAGAPLDGVVRLAPYRMGQAQLASTPVRFTWDGKLARFNGTVLVDGPISNGFVRGLALPVAGYASAGGGFVLGQGCKRLAFRELRLASFTFAGTGVGVCGRPIVARSAGGTLHIDAAIAPLQLTGRTSSGTPVTLTTAGAQLTERGFTARAVTARVGPPERVTHLDIATLDGTIGTRIGGHFAGAEGAIANVPLNIADASGGWTLDGGVLRLSGNLRVSDAAAAARFNPFVTNDAALSLQGSVIRADATLREPATGIDVAMIGIDHDLSRGTGQALIDVPGITFTPKGLQPERLTPITLGVVANVSGTVSGKGRIAWGAEGVTSSGSFGTERLDLAAAFGPVTGLKGQINFTDLLGLVSAPHQEATVAEINPGVAVTNGVVHYQLTGQSRVRVEDAMWPFAGGTLRLDPSELDFDARAQRHLTFRIEGLDAAAFVQQLDFPNISATGTFDGVLPMIFDHNGGRIEAGTIRARPSGGTLAYVGELTNAQLGTMGKLAFDALKAIRYSSLDISLDGRLDGEMVSRVRFTGVRQATPEQGMIARLVRNLPFRFNIQIRAPFRGLIGSARAYIDPRLLLNQAQAKPATPAEPLIQPPASGDVR